MQVCEDQKYEADLYFVAPAVCAAYCNLLLPLPFMKLLTVF